MAQRPYATKGAVMQNQKPSPPARLAYLLVCTQMLAACVGHQPQASMPIPQGWQDAPLLALDNEWGAYDYDMATDTQGNALAVWEQYDGERYNIWANRKLAGQGWGVAQRIDTAKSGNAYNPRIAVDSQGNAVAVWQQVDGAGTHIGANRYMVGTGWSMVAWIDAPDSLNAQMPQVRFDPQDRAMAIWQQHQGARMSMHASPMTANSGWGKAVQIAPAQQNAYNPSLAIDAQGFVIAQWLQSADGLSHIGQSRFVPGSGWGPVALMPYAELSIH
jgi:hypothetical protein